MHINDTSLECPKADRSEESFQKSHEYRSTKDHYVAWVDVRTQRRAPGGTAQGSDVDPPSCRPTICRKDHGDPLPQQQIWAWHITTLSEGLLGMLV